MSWGCVLIRGDHFVIVVLIEGRRMYVCFGSNFDAVLEPCKLFPDWLTISIATCIHQRNPFVSTYLTGQYAVRSSKR
jgi:hypothetical protein